MGKAKPYQGRVVVLMGGQSIERKVSFKSGEAVLSCLQQAGYDAIGYDVQALPLLVDFVLEHQDALFFIALHGGSGEDGTVQGLLEAHGCLYTGSDYTASALAMNKIRSKRLWQRSGVSTLPFVPVEGTMPSLEEIVSQGFSLPLIVKPVSSGSSYGISWVFNESDWDESGEKALSCDAHVLIEPCIQGKEYTVGIVGDRVLPPLLIEPDEGRYDYSAKYGPDATAQFHFPCGLSDDEIAQLNELARRAYDVLGCSGFGRVDVMRDNSGIFWVLEINTIPGFTPMSLLPYAAKQIGQTNLGLLEEIMAVAVLEKSRATVAYSGRGEEPCDI
jgi:D-alanine-D-alanine ligase